MKVHEGMAFGWKVAGSEPVTLQDGTTASVRRYGVNIPDTVGAQIGDTVLAVTAERGNRGASYTTQTLVAPLSTATVQDMTGQSVSVTLWKVEQVKDAAMTARLIGAFMAKQAG